MFSYSIQSDIQNLISKGHEILRKIKELEHQEKFKSQVFEVSYLIAPKGKKKAVSSIKNLFDLLGNSPDLHDEIKKWEFQIANFCNNHSLKQKNLSLEGNSSKLSKKFNQARGIRTPSLRIERLLEKLEELKQIDLIENSRIASYQISIGKKPYDNPNNQENSWNEKKIGKTTPIKRGKKKNIINPKVFLSYSWDSEYHQNWVKNLTNRLRENGIDATCDLYEMNPGKDNLKVMEEQIATSEFVLLICTPNFGNKANNRKGGVGYESQIISAELYEELNSYKKVKFICILRSGKPEKSIPRYLKSRYYLDFRNKQIIEENFKKLIYRLYQQSYYKKPPIGAPPPFKNT